MHTTRLEILFYEITNANCFSLQVASPKIESQCQDTLEKASAAVQEAATATAASVKSTGTSGSGSDDDESAAPALNIASGLYALVAMTIGAGMVML